MSLETGEKSDITKSFGGETMDKFLLKMLIPILMNIMEDLLSEENIKTYGDKLFDFIEDAVKNSDTTFDDATVLPLIAALRAGLNIPDNNWFFMPSIVQSGGHIIIMLIVNRSSTGYGNRETPVLSAIVIRLHKVSKMFDRTWVYIP